MTTLETQRLILRPLVDTDLDALYTILSDPITMSFWPSPFTREATQAWIERSKKSHDDHGFGRLAVLLKETGQLIGDCGLMRSEIDGVLENDLGYILSHEFWHRGYATEAAEACQVLGLDTLKLNRICANMPFDHSASQRVAETLGMRFEREFINKRNRDILTYLYAIEQTTGE